MLFGNAGGCLRNSACEVRIIVLASMAAFYHPPEITRLNSQLPGYHTFQAFTDLSP